MVGQQDQYPQFVSRLPKNLYSPGAKLVYLYIDSNKGATIDELQVVLRLKKVTLYPLIQTLRQNDLIEKVEGVYICQDRLGDKKSR